MLGKKESGDHSRANIYPSNATVFRDDSDGQLICETFHLKKKKKVTTRRVPFATFSTYVEMSQWNAFHQRRNDSSELHTSSNDRRNKGISPTYCVEIGMQVEASWPIAIVSRSSQILDTFKSPRLLGCSIGRETRRFNLDPSPCFLFYSFIFLLLFSFFFPPLLLRRSSTDSFLTRHVTWPGRPRWTTDVARFVKPRFLFARITGLISTRRSFED